MMIFVTSDDAEERWQRADTMQSIGCSLRPVWVSVQSSWQLWSQSRTSVLHLTRCWQQSRLLQHLCWMV